MHIALPLSPPRSKAPVARTVTVPGADETSGSSTSVLGDFPLIIARGLASLAPPEAKQAKDFLEKFSPGFVTAEHQASEALTNQFRLRSLNAHPAAQQIGQASTWVPFVATQPTFDFLQQASSPISLMEDQVSGFITEQMSGLIEKMLPTHPHLAKGATFFGIIAFDFGKKLVHIFGTN
jgi:hypothetical protein